MEQQHGEKHREIYLSVSSEIWLKSSVEEQHDVEHDLDGVKEARSVEKIGLVSLLHLQT